MTANSPLSPSAADELWLRMASRYGHSWVSQYGATPAGFAGAEWRETLAGISPAQLRVGFSSDALRGSDWPPSSSAFRAMCLSIPSRAAVRIEIDAKDSRRSQFTLLVLSKITDRYRFRTDGEYADRMLSEAYNEAREHVMRGGELPPGPAAEIEHQREEHAPARAETARSQLDAIASSLRLADIERADEAVAEHRMEARGS